VSKSEATPKPEESRAKEVIPPAPDPVRSTEFELRLELEKQRQEAEDLFGRIAKAIAGGKPGPVESYYLKILSLPLSADVEFRALFDFATYLDEQKINPVKAAAGYEKCLSIEPASPRAPLIHLRLADIYRQLGAESRSLNNLYEVLSSSIRASGDPKGENLARQAMLKIGNTHFEAGQYEEAAGIYSRLKLLDLSPEDQAFVLFRATELLFRRNQYEAAIEAGRQFLEQFPLSKSVPACRQLVVQSLDATGQQDQAVQETLALLLSTRNVTDPALATYWKMKTGNDLANVLYSHGEFVRALHMYQTMANLDNGPAWKLSAIYQIGLCFERLSEPRRALDAYRYAADAAIPAAAPGSSTASGISLQHLKDSAGWRARHIEWMVDVGTKLYPLLSSKIRPVQARPREAGE
jgi:tetratricopeptide (TPR) repeat protein